MVGARSYEGIFFHHPTRDMELRDLRVELDGCAEDCYCGVHAFGGCAAGCGFGDYFSDGGGTEGIAYCY